MLSGCSAPSLHSFMEFIDTDYTAAAHLNIQRECDREFLGQQLVVSWNLPARMSKQLPCSLHLWVYYGDGKVKKLVYQVDRLSSYRVYRLSGPEYQEHNGMVSYKVCLLHGDRKIVSRQHHLWTEVISLS